MRILFFTPFGGLSGSEMMLSYLLRGLDQTEFEAALFCPYEGELLASMPDSIPAYSHTAPASLWERVSERVGRRFRSTTLYEDRIVALHREFRPNLWYVNTILMPELLPLARRVGVPFVVHFHEMPMLYEKVTGEELKGMIEGASLAVACSQPVAEALRTLGAERVELLYECVDLGRVKADPARAAELRRGLGAGDGHFVWCMSGRFEYRKGADLFAALARDFGPDRAHFLWVGPRPGTGFDYFVERAVGRHGAGNVHLVGRQTDDYYNYLSCADGFLLTSREDPFPLVMIEAAALGKPVVSFDSGGVKEFVLPGMGAVVDSWNLPDLAGAMRGVMEGKTAFDPAVAARRAREFDVSAQVKRWESLLRDSAASLA